MTLLHRYAQPDTAEQTAIPDHYVDAAAVPSWAAEAFGWAIAAGIITGDDQGALNPQGLALRCQGAAIMERFHQTLIV